MTFEENYQSRKTLLANKLTNKGVNASDTEGMTTLINKVNDIQPETNNTLVLYTDKNAAENGKDIQLYALLLNNGTPVSGKTIMFFLNETISQISDSFYGASYIYNLYPIKGDGRIIVGNTSETNYHFLSLNMNNNEELRYSVVLNPPIEIKVENSIIYRKDDTQWKNFTGTGQVLYINDTDSTKLAVNVKSEITENTYAYGTAITNEYGIATLPYTCTGEGIQKITANYKNFITSKNLYDCIKYDKGILNSPDTNDIYEHIITVVLTRHEEYSTITRLEGAPSTMHAYLAILNLGHNNTLEFECCQVDGDYTSEIFGGVTSGNINFLHSLQDMGYSNSVIGEWHRFKVNLKNNGLIMYDLDNPAIEYEHGYNGDSQHFIFNIDENMNEIRIRNVKVYPTP